jgi:hypothetical protein
MLQGVALFKLGPFIKWHNLSITNPFCAQNKPCIALQDVSTINQVCRVIVGSFKVPWVWVCSVNCTELSSLLESAMSLDYMIKSVATFKRNFCCH